jgi:hypothetical protein
MIKSLISQLSVLSVVSGLLYVSFSGDNTIDFSKYSTQGQDLVYTVNLPNNTAYSEFSEESFNTFTLNLGKSYVGFKEALAFKESQGNYFRVNDFGYLGKYQFGKETLKLIGVYTPNQFLYNPELQEKAFIANLERNKWVLRKDIKRFVGKRMNGITITESGILAAAHLAGPGSVKKYLRSYGQNGFSDAFGTSIQNYMKKFSGYDTSFITPNKKAKVSKV